MGLINYSSIEDGTTIDASDVNTPLKTIYDEFNGSVDSNNIADGAVTNTALAGDITIDKLATGTTSLGYSHGTTGSLTTDYVTKATITATTKGGNVNIIWGAQMSNQNSGAARTATIQILCDGVATGITPATLTYDVIYLSGTTSILSYGFTHNQTGLAAGSHTWVIQYKASFASGAVSLNNNFLKVIEVI